jgi:hypothetical protein
VEHWFDSFTRDLGSQRLTRRGLLSLSVKLALAAGASLVGRAASPLGVETASAAPLGLPALAADPACTVEDSYGVLKSIATATSTDPTAPLTLSHTFIAEVGSGMTVATLAVTPGTAATAASAHDVIVRMTTSSQPNRAGQATATLGAAFTGDVVRRSSFSTDGTTIRGGVDGRPVQPSTTSPNEQRLTPNGPTPVAPSTPIESTGLTPRAAAMQQAVEGLLTQARSQIGTCSPRSDTSPVVATCTRCQLSCRETWLTCAIPVVQSSLRAGVLAPSAYLEAAQAACDAPLHTCLSTCKSSGACCPDFCKGNAECCKSAWGCCPPSSHSQRQWSRTWPTCPRCGAPPWTTATTPITPAPNQTCNPRPPVAVTTGPSGSGALLVTVRVSRSPSAAPDNTLMRIEIGDARNATVEISGQVRPAGGVSIPIESGSQSATFIIRRQTPGQTTTVPLTVTDACGTWQSMVGGGPAAF